jgi:hypothetical protein
MKAPSQSAAEPLAPCLGYVDATRARTNPTNDKIQ